MGENLSPADVAAVVGNTDRNNGFGFYPVFPYGGGFGGNSGFGGDGSWIWIILLLVLCGWGNNGNGGFGGFNNDYAWLSNGQKEIMQNTNNGFNTLQLSNDISDVKTGITGLSSQLCNCCNDLSSGMANHFYNAEIAANNRAVNQMQDTWALSRQFSDCCCDNKLAVQDLKATVISENCSDREVLRQIGQEILVNQNTNTQKIIDELFRDRLDEKDSKIQDLQRDILLKNLEASQIAQTTQTVDAIYNRLDTCPVGTTPVYGRTAIFSCPNNNGCGCNGFNGSI